MAKRHFLVVAALGAGEVPGATGRIGGDDGGLVVVVDVAALFALLAVGDHRAPFSHDDPTRNLYGQRATSEKMSISPANRILSEETASATTRYHGLFMVGAR